MELEAANRAMAAQLPAGASAARPQSPHLRSVLSSIEDINQARAVQKVPDLPSNTLQQLQSLLAALCSRLDV